MTNKVKVIDAICGAGKSSQMMQEIRDNSNKKWIYVSPYLTEVGDGNKVKGRIRETLPELAFACPEASKGKGNHLKQLLSESRNVAITHSLLTLMDKECLHLIKHNDYNLVIDETLDVISVYKGVHQHDIKGIIGTYVIKDESTGKLRWNYEKHGDEYAGAFKDIKDLCDLDSLYLHKDTVLINKLSPAVIKAASSVTILTYMFEGSFMCAWMKMAGIPYSYASLHTAFSPEEIKQSVREHLKISSTPKRILKWNYDARGLPINTAYSSTWYKTHTDSLAEIRRGCESFLTGLRKKKVKYKVFWTTFKEYQKVLAGSSYTRGTIITEDGERLEPFVTKNKRASNEHANCNVCMYLVNVYAHGDISAYMSGQGLELDNDAMALSEMVQFIFRGSIRKGEDMYLMIASERMKSLLERWLETPE